MTIGYACVLPSDKDCSIQLQQLSSLNIHKDSIFVDMRLTESSKRTSLKKAVAACGHEDTLVVWQLSCLGRSVKEITLQIKELQDKNIYLKSLKDNLQVDTTSNSFAKEIINALTAAMKELDREHRITGMRASMKRGRKLGRTKLLTDEQVAQVKKMLLDGESACYLADKFQVSDRTIRRIKQSL